MVSAKLKQQFSTLARDRARFHETLRTTFGSDYDVATAERLRQRALRGDFDWLPKVEFVSAETLGGANGAYDKAKGVVYLNDTLPLDRAASTFVEEAGHHLDTLINKSDAAGDEGELFRRLLAGEPLTAAQIQEIRNENDKGVIRVDGKDVEVEFWNPIKSAARAIKKVGKAVGKVVKGAAKAVGSAAMGVFEGVKKVGEGIVEGVGGFTTNLFRGRFADALTSLVNGADKAFFQSVLRVTEGLFDAANHVTEGIAEGIGGKVGQALREVLGRVIDVTHTAVSSTIGAARDLARVHTDSAISLLRGLGRSAQQLLRGDFKDAAASFGMSFVNAATRWAGGNWDVAMRATQGVASIGATAIGKEPPARRLTEDERRFLEQTYGDAIDLDMVRIKRGGTSNLMAPHVVGNTVYLPDRLFTVDAAGDHVLTSNGRSTLVHELAHVWQNQTGGGKYIHQAQGAGAIAIVDTGDRNNAYPWRPAVAAGVPFAELNPEQQAEIPELVANALLNGDGTLDRADLADLSDEEFAYVLASMEIIRPGFIREVADSKWSSAFSPAWRLLHEWRGDAFPRTA